MKKVFLFLTVILGFVLTSCDKADQKVVENLSTCIPVGQTFSHNEMDITITEAFHNPLEQSSKENEKIITIKIDYPIDRLLLSNEVQLHSIYGDQYVFFSTDGLDYLGGSARNEPPFVRFSVPKDQSQFVLYVIQDMEAQSRVCITLDDE